MTNEHTFFAHTRESIIRLETNSDLKVTNPRNPVRGRANPIKDDFETVPERIESNLPSKSVE